MYNCIYLMRRHFKVEVCWICNNDHACALLSNSLMSNEYVYYWKMSSLQIDHRPSLTLGKTLKLSMPPIGTGVTAMGAAHLAAGTAAAAAALPIVGCILVAIQLRTTATIGSISQHYQVLLCYYFHSRSILHLHTIPLLDAKYILYNSLLLC
jgi:hypothetical protein